MASTKLTCPECSTVLRPTKPVAPGKKVKCPKCETVFAAPAEVEEVEEVEEVRPRKAASKVAAAKPARQKEEKPAAKADDDDEGTYGYIKEPEETQEEKKKKKIRHGPDTSVKDPRGPATVKLAGPTGKLQLAGSIGALGWLILALLITFPAVFPIAAKDKENLKNVAEKGLGNSFEKPKEKPKAAMPPFWTLYGFDFDKHIIMLPWYTFMAAMIPFVLLACYCAAIVSGGIKAQNLESRAWGIVASVMALLPLVTLGVGIIAALVLQWLSALLLDEVDLGVYVGIGVNALLWLVCAGIGGWNLRTLMDEEVQEGFTYVPE